MKPLKTASLPSYFFGSVFRPLVSAGAKGVFGDPRGSPGSGRRPSVRPREIKAPMIPIPKPIPPLLLLLLLPKRPRSLARSHFSVNRERAHSTNKQRVSELGNRLRSARCSLSGRFETNVDTQHYHVNIRLSTCINYFPLITDHTA